MYAVRIAMLLALATAPLTAWGQPPVLIDCHDAVGIPGGTASVTVSLLPNDQAVVGTQNDLTFDDTRVSIQAGACVINPLIGSGTEFNKDIDQNVLSDPARVRAIIVSLSNFTVIPEGLLYTCPFRVADDAPEGTYDVANGNFVASTENGTRLPVDGASCHIVVAATTQTPTATPRCRENSDCPSGQVCVDGECVDATPTPTPIGFCEDNNDCPPGEVCVDHHCVTPTPTPVATRTNTPIGFCNDTEDCPPGQVCLNHECVTPTPTPQCQDTSDCPSGQVCVDGTCVAATPTATPTLTPKKSSGGGGGCNCEIDPGAPASRASDVLAVLLPALLLVLRWRARRSPR